MRHTFHSEQWLPYPVELVFAFFADPENLPRLLPPWQKARIEKLAFVPPPPHPTLKTIAAGAGTRLTLSFRLFPLSPMRISWQAEITEFLCNDHFCDRQLRGPFAFWNHCHHIHPETRATESRELTNGTRVRDVIEYQMPLGPLGEFAYILAERQLRAAFNYRRHRTESLLSRMSEAI